MRDIAEQAAITRRNTRLRRTVLGGTEIDQLADVIVSKIRCLEYLIQRDRLDRGEVVSCMFALEDATKVTTQKT